MVVLMTWNLRGVISCTTCLSTLLEKGKCDLVIIRNHKFKDIKEIILIHYIITMLVLLNGHGHDFDQFFFLRFLLFSMLWYCISNDQPKFKC